MKICQKPDDACIVSTEMNYDLISLIYSLGKFPVICLKLLKKAQVDHILSTWASLIMTINFYLFQCDYLQHQK